MHDAVVVCGAQRVRDLDHDVDNFVECEGAGLESPPQADALEELHGDERLTFAVLDVENRADVGMVERR